MKGACVGDGHRTDTVTLWVEVRLVKLSVALIWSTYAPALMKFTDTEEDV